MLIWRDLNLAHYGPPFKHWIALSTWAHVEREKDLPHVEKYSNFTSNDARCFMQPMQNNDILFVAFIKNVIFDICIPAAYQKYENWVKYILTAYIMYFWTYLLYSVFEILQPWLVSTWCTSHYAIKFMFITSSKCSIFRYVPCCCSIASLGYF